MENLTMEDVKVEYKVTTTINQDMKDAVLNVLESGKFSLGWEGLNFEREFAKMYGIKHAITLNSGTSGLISAMTAVNLGPGDEVILSPFTFWGAVDVIMNVGATPVFVEPIPETFNIDPTKIEAAITSKTKAIEPVHMYGQPCDMDPINEIAKAHDLSVIEDACHACGAKYKGRYTGALGDAGSFSFSSKNITCGGEGGMAVTNDTEIYEGMRSLRYLGTTGTYAEGTRSFDSSTIGYNFRMPEISAAIGRRQLKELPKWHALRNKNAKLYGELLEDIPEVQSPVVLDDCEHAYLHYVVKAKKRDDLKEYLTKQGIVVKRIYAWAIHLGTVYRKQFGYKEGNFPITEQLITENLGLPVQPFLKEEQIQYVVDAIRKFYK